MAYVPTRRPRRNLRSVRALEEAMKARDLSGRELARLVSTSGQSVSQLRLGLRQSVGAEVADAIERALRVDRGALFGRPYTIRRLGIDDEYEAAA